MGQVVKFYFLFQKTLLDSTYDFWLKKGWILYLILKQMAGFHFGFQNSWLDSIRDSKQSGWIKFLTPKRFEDSNNLDRILFWIPNKPYRYYYFYWKSMLDSDKIIFWILKNTGRILKKKNLTYFIFDSKCKLDFLQTFHFVRLWLN